MKENCVLCNKETSHNINDDIGKRFNYVDGAGQLCKECYKIIYS